MGFGIEAEKVELALTNGIERKMPDGSFRRPVGYLSLAYMHSLGEYVLVYGTCEYNAGHVRVSDYGKTWRIIDAEEGQRV